MNVAPELLNAALEGLEAKLSRVNSMIAEIKAKASANRAPTTKEPVTVKRTKRNVSLESRKKMAEAQRKRWAKQSAEE